MSILKEFRDFAMKGNVIDLAVGVVIGASFQKIVSALVEKIIMPIMSFLTQGKSVADMKYTFNLPDAIRGDADITPAEIGYGAFLQAAIDFMIVAFAIFMFIKLINYARKRFEKEVIKDPPPAPENILLLREIRDSLARQAPRRAE